MQIKTGDLSSLGYLGQTQIRIIRCACREKIAHVLLYIPNHGFENDFVYI